ncbi:MAG: hypothetical protein HGA96_14670 [Desulfobulbaceae bacterium]|nr:hypothetical protein [Desulfobulbaceae bacterium]
MVTRFVPAVQVKTRIFVAALLWSGIGAMLMVRGVLAVSGSGREIWLAPAIILGGIKSRLVLDRLVRRNMVRLGKLDGARCLGGVYSAKTWLMVAGMILLGRALRLSPVPVWITGMIYMTVGWGLFWSSRVGWVEWLGFDRAQDDSNA